LADRIGTTQSQVWYWLTRSKRGVPAEFASKIEEATGVPRSDLRPDIWPAEARA
jgi:DNA-binding transcriptional regulator YdaS (Cro superfamily)